MENALDEESFAKASGRARRSTYTKHGLSAAETDLALGLEEAYPRATPGTIRLIVPKHLHLSKMFQAWLRKQHGIESHREVQQIDMKFVIDSQTAMAEFKIAYDHKTKHAVREALGQILEYNHYPTRKTSMLWLLVLDQAPTTDDCAFVTNLRSNRDLPIYLSWKHDDEFTFHPRSPLS